MTRYASGDAPRWEAALELYQDDRVVEAFELAAQHGVGQDAEYARWYRVLEAEAVTRNLAQTEQLLPWLRLESVPEETWSVIEEVRARSTHSCQSVLDRFGLVPDPDECGSLITILTEQVDGPWTASPHGFCVDKDSVYKICLPAYLLEDLDEFERALRHEFAHVVTLCLGQDQAPRWLEEAISMVCELEDRMELDPCPPESWRVLPELEKTLDVQPTEAETDSDDMYDAYTQCGHLGFTLLSMGGSAKIGELLVNLADPSVVARLGALLMGRNPMDRAIRLTYGTSLSAFFQLAKDQAGAFRND